MQVKSVTARNGRLASTGIDCVNPSRLPPPTYTHATLRTIWLRSVAVHSKLSCNLLRNNMVRLFLCFRYKFILITGGQSQLKCFRTHVDVDIFVLVCGTRALRLSAPFSYTLFIHEHLFTLLTSTLKKEAALTSLKHRYSLKSLKLK
jgi:hypothetical protein